MLDIQSVKYVVQDQHEIASSWPMDEAKASGYVGDILNLSILLHVDKKNGRQLNVAQYQGEMRQNGRSCLKRTREWKGDRLSDFGECA